MAAAAGAAALQALAEGANPLGDGFAGADDGAVAPAREGANSPDGSEDDEDEQGSMHSARGSGGASPPPAGRPPVPAGHPAYGVSAELAAIAQDADPVLGPKIVRALAVSRQLPAMQRAYVRHLEVPTVGSTLEALGPALADPDRTRFRQLAGLLVAELAQVDGTLDPGAGVHDVPSLVAALRELMELCATAHRAATPSPAVAMAPPAATSSAMVTYDPGAAAAAIGTAMANALGSSLGAVFAGLPPPVKPAEKKGEKLTAGQMFAYLDAFNARPSAETQVGPHQVANRTVAAHVRDSVLVHGLWPQDKAASTEMMSPFGTLTGGFNGTDVSALEINLSTGKVEDVSRDPRASAAASTEEYLAKVRLLVTTIAVMLYGVRCDKAPHHIAGHEAEDFCSILQCNEFLAFADTLAKGPLVTVRNMVELTLSDIARAANARSGERVSFTHAIKDGLVQLRRRAESFTYAQMSADSAAGSSGADVTPPAGDKGGNKMTEEGIVELIKSAAGLVRAGGGGGRGKGGGRGRGAKAQGDRKAAYEERKRAREVEREYDVGGSPTKRKMKKGGHSDAPKCTRPGCHKESWCWYSHAHL